MKERYDFYLKTGLIVVCLFYVALQVFEMISSSFVFNIKFRGILLILIILMVVSRHFLRKVIK